MSLFSRIVFGGILLMSSPLLSAADCDEPGAGLPSNVDWAAAAQESRSSDRPIMVVFGADDCHYCDRLKAELLGPMLEAGTLQKTVVFREFDINADGKVNDFDGVPVRSRIFVERYRVFATPTVVLLGPDGNRLTDPIVGYDERGEYEARLRTAIEEARIAFEKVDAGQGEVAQLH